MCRSPASPARRRRTRIWWPRRLRASSATPISPSPSVSACAMRRARPASLYDDGAYEPIAAPESPTDPLKFRDIKRYADRLKEHRAKTGASDAVLAAHGRIEGQEVVAAVHDFAFQGGTLGMAAGEAIVTAMTLAVEKHAPFVIFTASGGARMQEGMFSLM